MSVLEHLTAALRSSAVEVVDLTAPLCEQTPVIQLPAERGQPWPFARELISQYDVAGPHVYWNNIRMSEHTGTHFDAPVHWLSGRHLEDVSQVPPRHLLAPAAVLDFSREAAEDADFLLQREHVEEWEREHGALPDGGWLLFRTGWDARSGCPEDFLNGGHTPGISPACARYLAQETELIGIGVETVGTDAGLAADFEPEFPCHWYFQGARKYGLTQLRRLAVLPPQGAMLVAAPLPIVGGSGSPARVLALVERTSDGLDRAKQLHRRHLQDVEPARDFELLDRRWTALAGVFSPIHTPVTGLFTSWLPLPEGGNVLEMGSGTGVTAVSAALAGCRVTALDISATAVENTRINARRHGVADRVDARVSDLFDALGPEDRYDLIYWNSNFALAPADAVPDDDLGHALFDAGYQTHRRFLAQAGRHLVPGGRLILGFSDLGDWPELRDACSAAGLVPEVIRAHREQLEVSIEFQLVELRPAANAGATR